MGIMHVHREGRQSEAIRERDERRKLLERPVTRGVRSDHAQQSAQVDSGGSN